MSDQKKPATIMEEIEERLKRMEAQLIIARKTLAAMKRNAKHVR